MKGIFFGFILLLSVSVYGQIESYFGIYYIGHYSGEGDFVVEESCWSGAPDIFEFERSEDPEWKYAMAFHGFHTEFMAIDHVESNGDQLILFAYNTEEETPVEEKFVLTRLSADITELTEIRSNSSYLLVGRDNFDAYLFIPCEEDILSDEAGDLPYLIDVFSMILEGDPEVVPYYVNDSGFTALYPKEGDVETSQKFLSFGDFIDNDYYSRIRAAYANHFEELSIIETGNIIDVCDLKEPKPVGFVRTEELDGKTLVHMYVVFPQEGLNGYFSGEMNGEFKLSAVAFRHCKTN